MAKIHSMRLPMSSALRSLSDAVVMIDFRGAVTYLNVAAERLTGWDVREATGRALGAVVPLVAEDTRQPIALAALDLALGSASFGDGLVMIRRDGIELALCGSAAPFQDGKGATVGVVLVFRDDSERRRVDRRLQHDATHDVLTGLPNRREFERRLAQLVPSARADDVTHSVLYIDLDRFKAVNDRGGHAAGDALLTTLGAIMTRQLREGDTLARLGGDEFAVLLPYCTRLHAERIAGRICAEIADLRFAWSTMAFSVGASIGLLPMTGFRGEVADVVRAVDCACYTAKRLGGNRVSTGEIGQQMRAANAVTLFEPMFGARAC